MVCASSAPLPIRVNNAGGDLKLLTPDIAKPWSGTVKITVTASRPLLPNDSAEKTTQALLFFIDGRQVGQVWGSAKGSTDVDSTRLANGSHTLLVSAWATSPGNPPFAMLQLPITVNNGHHARELRARWRELRLAPGQSITLAPRLVFTDGDEALLTDGVSFTSIDGKIAAVNPHGIVTALAPGVTDVRLVHDVFQTTVRVFVSAEGGLPHFARDGQILTTYDPLRSFFVRSLNNLEAREVQETPGLLAQLRAASLNTLTTSFFHNPDGDTGSYDNWRRAWDPAWDKLVRDAQIGDYSLLLTGDELTRSPGALSTCIGSPWAPKALQYAFTRARDSKTVVCVTMTDDVNTVWGETPTPAGGRWTAKTPTIPDDAFSKFMAIVNQVSDRPPVTWPVSGSADAVTARNWMGDPAFSDFASHAWTIQDWRRAYPSGAASLPQLLTALNRVVLGRELLLPRNIPALLDVDLSGTPQTKETGDDMPRDPLDSSSEGMVTAALVPMYAAATGMAGVRGVAYDSNDWKRRRAYAAPGQSELPVGTDPFTVGTARWQGLAAAGNLLHLLEPDLLQSPLHALNLDPAIITGARQGKAGRLFMASNFSERPETSHVDLGFYKYDKGPAIVRYHLLGAQLRTELIPPSALDTVTFAPGETIVWVCRPLSASDVVPPAVQITEPHHGATVAGNVAITILAMDNTRLDRLECTVDGQLLATLKGAPPYLYSWDATAASPKVWHSIVVTAYDADNNASQARIAVRTTPKDGDRMIIK